MPNLRIILSMLLILSLSIFSGCGRSDRSQDADGKVIAEINNYKLTEADFRSEAQKSLPGNISNDDFERAKDGLLDDMIIKKLLIQEAQKQNFDKDRAFIKEIERYWEQALLKLLYNKKSRELSREISMSESDPKNRDVKVQQALNTWIEDLKKHANIKKYKENLKAVRQQSEKDS